MQRQNRNQQRKRQSYQRDHRCTHIHQEKEENDDHEETSLKQTVLDIIDRAINETALTENIC